MEQERTCCTCEFWDQRTFHKKARNAGLCRIDPPARNGSDKSEWSWPETWDEDWCSHFAPAKEEKKP